MVVDKQNIKGTKSSSIINSKTKMINTALIEEKYKEMNERGIDEDFLDPAFGQLKIFINHKPEVAMFSVQLEVDRVYIGSEELL